MADASTQPDVLSLYRQSVISGKPPTLTTSPEISSITSPEPNLARSTHLHFTHDGHYIYPLDLETRFQSAGQTIDLRSVVFALQKKDTSITEYLSEVTRLNTELATPGSAGGSIRNLTFADKLDLITWLEGFSEDSENIKPLAPGERDVAAASKAGADPRQQAQSRVQITRPERQISARLKKIYDTERKMGDRNSILRGIKPTDFSHVRKSSEPFLRGLRGKAPPSTNGTVAPPPVPVPVPSASRKPKSKLEPIILLSPSASSLLRMSNIKSFLDDGIYTPPDSSGSTANLLFIVRKLPSIDPHRPLRFTLVDSPDMFKPDYWSRVVAVFTTGQAWQFKSYKWQSPPDLFSHVLGVHIGWKGEDTPGTVKSWGRGVISDKIDPWHPNQPPQARWRDREVVEGIWRGIEESMRNKGMQR